MKQSGNLYLKLPHCNFNKVPDLIRKVKYDLKEPESFTLKHKNGL